MSTCKWLFGAPSSGVHVVVQSEIMVGVEGLS